MKLSSKTPYEIRLDLLVLARNILQSQYESQNERTGITAPTSEEILAEAEKLNAFVSKAALNH